MRSGRRPGQVSIPYRYDKNRWYGGCGVGGGWFQFLIGTIKTMNWSTPLTSTILVSIPYRYDKNLFDTRKIRKRDRFQFLIGTIKTLISLFTQAPSKYVSIPYRYDKNYNS